MVVRVLGQMLGESPAQILGMLSYSWWPCNLLHTAQCTGKGETTAQSVLITTINPFIIG